MKFNKRFAVILMIGIVFILAVTACGGGASYDPEVVATGKTKFEATCSACHGVDLKGMPNLGKNLLESEFITSQSDADLLAMIKTGRPIGHELNSTGIDMPPKGGNPALSDEDINAIIAYIRTSTP